MTNTDDAVNSLLINDGPKDECGVTLNHYGQYVLPNPETGELIGHTRVTTLSKILDDATALETYQERVIVKGIGQSEDLFALAASVATITDPDDKKILDTVRAQATERGGGSVKSNLGTGMHGMTQRLDLGENFDIPEMFQRDIAAYQDGQKTYGIWPHGRYVERVAFDPELKIAGTLDRILMADGWMLPRIGDLKTGKVDGQGRKFAVQLAFYAHMPYLFDYKTKTVSPMPEIDQETAVIIHLPIGEGRCDFYEVNIADGWLAAELAMQIYAWRKRNDLCVPLSKWEPAPERKSKARKVETVEAAVLNEEVKPIPVETQIINEAKGLTPSGETHRVTAEQLFAERYEWVKARVKFVAVKHGRAQDLAETWNGSCPQIPPFGKGGPTTNEEIDLVAGACHLVEMAFELPFFEPDPKTYKHYEEGLSTNEQFAIG